MSGTKKRLLPEWYAPGYFLNECSWCGRSITQRLGAGLEAGRPRKYCDNGGVCRQQAFRWRKRHGHQPANT